MFLDAEFRYKQAIVVRTDLNMGKGKMAGQVGHAAVLASEATKRRHIDWWKPWFEEGQCKVVLKVSSSDELEEIERRASSLGISTAIVQDRGLTQLDPGTVTCVGIGPAPGHLVDRVTGTLKLL